MKINYILSHKTSLNRIQNIEILQNILSDHSGNKLEVNKNKATRIAGKETIHC